MNTEDVNTLLEPFQDDLHSLIGGKLNSIKIEAPDSKSERTSIHQAISAAYPQLSTSTIRDGDHTVIVVYHTRGKTDLSVPKRKTTKLPKGLPYCRFVLYKEGRDTISAIQLLSSHLRVNPGCFSYAGTKDKRAITTQFVAVKGIDSERLASLNHRLPSICMGNFCYSSSPLFLGDLVGNEFTIVLRSITNSVSIIEEAIHSWTANGFINYYGLQRFGHSSKSKSFEIGKYLIRGEWSHAIDLILMPTSADLPHVRQIKELFAQSGNAADCASDVPPSVERHLLQGIAKHGKTLNALQLLPRNLRQLYAHSYQSLLWNRVASRRISRLGLNNHHALPGDLYFTNPQLEEPEPYSSLTDNPVKCDSHPRNSRSTLPSPEVATIENCDQIPLTSVVLPLPGFDVRYPSNEVGDWYSELLGEDGLTLNDLRHRVKDFSLPGSYRTLLVKPKNVSHHFSTYSDPNIPLVKSDLQLLNEATSTSDPVIDKVDTCSAHSHRALVLRFTLPKSSYATMAIRELTKSAVEIR